MNKKIDKFVENVANQLSEDKFELSQLEKTIGDFIYTYQYLVVNTAERLLNDKSEKEIIRE